MKPTQKFYKMPQALFSDKYSQLSNDAKILYMAPTFYADSSENQWSDYNYQNPIEAFEAGYFYAKEADR